MKHHELIHHGACAVEEEGFAGVQLYDFHEGVVGFGEGHAAAALVSNAHRDEIDVLPGVQESTTMPGIFRNSCTRASSRG